MSAPERCRCPVCCGPPGKGRSKVCGTCDRAYTHPVPTVAVSITTPANRVAAFRRLVATDEIDSSPTPEAVLR